MRVIAFDQAKATGWAVYDGTRWISGALRCPIKRHPDAPTLCATYTGEVVSWYLDHVAILLREHVGDPLPDFAALEMPLVTDNWGRDERGAKKGPQINIQTIHALHSIAGAIGAALRRQSIPVEYVAQGTWRRSFGVKRGEGVDLKKAAVDVCKTLRIPVTSSDEAEAVGIAWHLWGVHGRKLSRHEDSPLFDWSAQ